MTAGFGPSGGSCLPVAKTDDREQVSLHSLPTAPPNLATHPKNSASLPQGASRYRTLSELGRGGWGYVLQARDEQLNRDVAIKQISGNFSNREAVHQRFLYEAQITGQLQHPGIVPVHELGIAKDGSPFYVMKLLEGATFKQTIADVHNQKNSLLGGFSVDLLERFVDVCNAVAFAHQRQIVHRDLKPANIMVGQFGETIVVDWGLAKQIDLPSDEATLTMPSSIHTTEPSPPLPSPDSTLRPGESSSVSKNRDPKSQSPKSRESVRSRRSRSHKSGSQTQHGTLLGTPAYMSPEQSRGEVDGLGPATDIYALGVILYEVLTGENPFRCGDVEATLNRVQTGEYQPARTVKKVVPKALAAICTTAMALQPGDRYGSAEQIVKDIQSFLAGEPVSVYREPIWVKAIRWCKRRPALTAGGLGSIAVLMVSSLVFSAVIHQAHQAEQRARLEAEDAKQRALVRLSEARQASDTWLVDLSGALQFYPGMDGLRQQLLEQAAKHYGSLATDLATQEAPDAPTRLEKAKCHIRLGDLQRLLGQFSLSADQYASAERLLTTPADKELPTQQRIEAINAQIGLALLSPSNQRQSNAVPLEKQLDHDADWLRQKLVSADSGTRELLRLVNTLARLQLAVSRRDDLLISQRSERLAEAEHWGEYLVKHRGDPRDHQLLQTIRDDLASSYVLQGRLKDASYLWLAEINRVASLVESRPKRPDLLQSRAFVTMKYAGILTQLGRVTEAIECYQSATTDLDEAWRLSDADAFYRRNTAISKANLGRLASERLGQAGAAESYLLEAIEQLGRAVAIDGPVVSDLVRLAECYESLGNLGEKTGASDTLKKFDLAAQCYAVIEDHGALTPWIRAKRAKMLTLRASVLLRLGRSGDARADYELAQRLIDAGLKEESKGESTLNAAQLASIGRLEARVMEVGADLLETEGNLDASAQHRDLTLAKLEALAIGERDAPATDAYPLAMRTLVDRLVERKSATQADLLKAADWLEVMRGSCSSVVDSSDWQQRKATVHWLLSNAERARIAIAKAITLQPDDRLGLVLHTAIFSGSVDDPLEEATRIQLQSLGADLPGDRRVQFWVDRLVLRPK